MESDMGKFRERREKRKEERLECRRKQSEQAKEQAAAAAQAEEQEAPAVQAEEQEDPAVQAEEQPAAAAQDEEQAAAAEQTENQAEAAKQTEETAEEQAEAAGQSEETAARQTEETVRQKEKVEAAVPEVPSEDGKDRLVRGMAKTRKGIFGNLRNIFRGFSHIDEEFYEEIEETLVMADIGVHATEAIIENLKVKIKENRIREPEACREFLIESIKEQMRVGETAYRFENETSVVMVIGVNGVGKTTTIGKLASKFKGQGKKVILAAADTFRAAAGEQLEEWAHRAGVELIGGQEGADPGSVVFDAVAAAKARKADILICDTAGRLHNKKNLMEELKKLDRILTREYPEAYRETLVVLDATTGQNGLVQAKQFSEAAEISGIILTKMDGTAKGGIAVAIQSELGVPVKYIGVGERVEDLQKFDSDQFVDALFAD